MASAPNGAPRPTPHSAPSSAPPRPTAAPSSTTYAACSSPTIQHRPRTAGVSNCTLPQSPEFGGNGQYPLLAGNLASNNPNANAVLMIATFWIETVEHKIVVPIFNLGQPAVQIAAPANRPGQPSPVFHVEPPRDILEPITITVTSTQIQYSQVVFLNFAGLTWPHVSVATLVPSAPVPVPLSAWT